ncbi:MAG TPA: HD domain-containing phosphohydrolase [Bryobacteraceae bacterium]|nr:HD domain-containing phosphohydrolase [Bryobacteraceae bacterium]
MERKTEKQVFNHKLRHSCKAVPACGRDQWRDLLLLGSRETAEPESAMASGFTIDETEQIVFALALAVEQRDLQTGGHCERLAFIAMAMGIAMGLARHRVMALYRGGYLHDVGKVGIPDSILFKPGPLTAEEWVTMRSHTTRGEEICRHMKSLTPVLPIIRHHHERWDGSGYPDGLRGEQIPLLARILQIADIYDALANPRPYKPACTSDQALDIIHRETDRGWRDPRIVKVFLELHGKVLSKMTRGVTPERDGIDSMRVSLANLQRMLSADALSIVNAS